jgi:hypothetical protein
MVEVDDGNAVVGVFDSEKEEDGKEDEVTGVGLGLAEVLEGVAENEDSEDKNEVLDADDD